MNCCVYFQGSESEVRRHEQTANEQHFDILVKHVEEVDLKRIQSNTRLEVRTTEIALECEAKTVIGSNGR